MSIDVPSFELIISLGNVAFFNHSKSFNNITIATTKRLHSHMGPSSTFVLTTHIRLSSHIYYGLLGVILIDAELLTAIVRIISQIPHSRISAIPTICIYIHFQSNQSKRRGGLTVKQLKCLVTLIFFLGSTIEIRCIAVFRSDSNGSRQHISTDLVLTSVPSSSS